MKNNSNYEVKTLEGYFGRNEIVICSFALKNKVGSSIIDTTKGEVPAINDDIKFIQETTEMPEGYITSMSSIFYGIRKLKELYENNKELVVNADTIHLLINDATFKSYIYSTRYGNVLDKILCGKIKTSEMEHKICTFIKQVTTKFPNLIIDPISISKALNRETHLSKIIDQTCKLVLPNKKANKETDIIEEDLEEIA